MTTWQEHKEARPLRGAAAKTYDAERDAMGVGYVILTARASAGLTQEQLAREIGTSQSTVARWESGAQIPSVRSLLKIADASGFDLAVRMRARGASDDRFEVLETLHAYRPPPSR